MSGLQDYLLKDRRTEFERTFVRQMLTYALGRSLLISDEPLIQRCLDRTAEGAGVHAVVEQIVTSPQFLNRRQN
jgi:hypothetical protein